jgi:tetratricopeptide (TPR) repeat protein
MPALRFAILVALAGAAIGDCRTAYAQSAQGEAVFEKTGFTMPTPKERKVYRKALRATFAHPSDPDTLARFAEIATRYGDMEGAISALERLLLIDNNQPELKLELGVLHYRMGSKQAAINYLTAAQASPDASPYVHERADVFLKAARR